MFLWWIILSYTAIGSYVDMGCQITAKDEIMQMTPFPGYSRWFLSKVRAKCFPRHEFSVRNFRKKYIFNQKDIVDGKRSIYFYIEQQRNLTNSDRHQQVFKLQLRTTSLRGKSYDRHFWLNQSHWWFSVALVINVLTLICKFWVVWIK